MMRAIVFTEAKMRLRRTPWRRSLQQAIDWAIALIREWRRRSRGRVDLSRLDERMLRDIGVTRVEAWREFNKPFWRQ
jgi:uncharacterized protein YjiS (DUF1127 family)